MDQIHKLLGHTTRWKPKSSWSFKDGLRQRSAKTEGTKRIVLLSCSKQSAVAEPQQVAEQVALNKKGNAILIRKVGRTVLAWK
ncbi:hypothetical protein SESBI_32683 [Sesbania bispinosa]|nr:hypothetical protein SESBI_32683 [Sesbania bispinosa]